MGYISEGLTTSTITIRVKDGKAKISFDGTIFEFHNGVKQASWEYGVQPFKKPFKVFDNWQQAVNDEEIAMIESYKISLAKNDDNF